MFQRYIACVCMDVAKVHPDVAYVMSVSEACCKRLLKNVSSVSDLCCKCFLFECYACFTPIYVARVGSKCCSCFSLMLE
jgi:hypothetical protein